MNKIVLGLILGTVLGAFDGLSAWMTSPEVRDGILEIVIGSTGKGLVAGILCGWFARKVDSMPLGILLGLVLGFGFAMAVYLGLPPELKHRYWEVILPGSIVGLIVGFATQKYGRRPEPRSA